MTDALTHAALAHTLTQHPLIEKLGWVLLHFLWEGTLVAGVLALLLLLMRHRPPSERYAMSLLALAVMVVLPVVTWQVLPAASPPAAPPAVVQPAPASYGAPETGSIRSLVAERSVAPGRGSAFAQRALDGLGRGAPLLALGWVLGVVVLAVRTVGGWGYTLHLKGSATPAPEAWQRRFQALMGEAGLGQGGRTPGLRVSVRTGGPAVVGWLRPVVLVPAGFLTGLPPAQVEAILRHELAHVRRHDYLAGLAQAVVETLLFYHPAVWWVSGRVRTLREHCCDDWAAGAGEARLIYARALAALEEWRSVPPLAPAGAGGSLLGRIRRLAGQQAPSAQAFGAAAVAVVALLVLGACAAGATMGETNAPEDDGASPPEEQRAASPSPAAPAAADTLRRSGETPARPDRPPARSPQVRRQAPRVDSPDRPGRDAWRQWAERQKTWGEQWQEWGERWQEQMQDAPRRQAWREQWQRWGDSVRAAFSRAPRPPDSLKLFFRDAPHVPAPPPVPENLFEGMPAVPPPPAFDSLRSSLMRPDTLPQTYYLRDDDPRLFRLDSLGRPVPFDPDSLLDSDNIDSIEVVKAQDSLRALIRRHAFPDGFAPEALVRIHPKHPTPDSDAPRAAGHRALQQAADRLEARAEALEEEGRDEAARALREEAERLDEQRRAQRREAMELRRQLEQQQRQFEKQQRAYLEEIDEWVREHRRQMKRHQERLQERRRRSQEEGERERREEIQAWHEEVLRQQEEALRQQASDILARAEAQEDRAEAMHQRVEALQEEGATGERIEALRRQAMAHEKQVLVLRQKSRELRRRADRLEREFDAEDDQMQDIN